MEIVPQLFTAKVMHKRLFPKVNAFNYNVYYVALPLPAVALPSRFQHYPHDDLGYRDGRDPQLWAQEILESHGFSDDITHIILVTMPRIFGYVFNPVSFYLCLDKNTQLRAVISEVHNTFGEQHSYLCAHQDHRIILSNEWLDAEKLFHVSPFLERVGHYRFKFNLTDNGMGIWIDYYNEENNKQLITSLIGNFSPLTKKNLSHAFWKHPLVTIKTILLIHWQALRLVAKRIRYIPKPTQLTEKLTISSDLTKM